MSTPTPAPARPDDLSEAVALVDAAVLPTEGIAEHFPRGYAVIRGAEGIVAVAGLEAHGGAGLLRSVAVAPSHRGKGLARRLVEDRLRFAHAQGLGIVYLLTTTAADYFRTLGFADVPRHEAPEALQRSSEFARLCPASAACLARRLP